MAQNTNKLDEYRPTVKAQYFTPVKGFLEFIGKPYSEINKKDLELFLVQIENERTRYGYHMAIRHFFKWLNDGQLPEHLYIKAGAPKFRETYKPGDMWEEKEVLLAIETRDNDRDKALIATIYDLAGRTHEVLDLKIDDIAFRDNYAEVMLTDHTGQRVLPIIFAYPYLLKWINNHPLKNKKNAPLWVTLKGVPRKISYEGIHGLFAKMERQLKDQIKKPFKSYVLRHSRLTHYADVVTEFQMRKIAGWTMRSNMPQRYLHMSMKGVKETLLEHHGITKRENKGTILVPKKCPRCQSLNTTDAKFCEKCTLSLTLGAWEESRLEQDELKEQLRMLCVAKVLFLS